MTAFTLPRVTRRTGLAAAAASLFAGPAFAANDAQDLVRRARITLDEARHDQQFGDAPRLFHRAHAVMVVPQFVKGGLFLGGEGGNAVLFTPSGEGWGNPLFYTLAAVSFGLQIGIEEAEVVLFVMSQKALRAWTQDSFTLGAKAGLTVLVVGSNASAAATANANVDVIAWAKSKGAYAGITLEGSGIKPRDEYNIQYYGHSVSPNRVLNLS
jgi:lipid-binding SYLF domain-containing protein